MSRRPRPCRKASGQQGRPTPGARPRGNIFWSDERPTCGLFAAELRSTGELREDLRDEQVADVVWSTNAAEYWLLLEQRGWTSARYETLLVDLWSRMLLA